MERVRTARVSTTLLVAWLETRPGDEHGDAWGRSHLLAPLTPLSRPEAALRRIVADLQVPSLGEDVRGAVVDLLFASSGIEPEVVAAADSIEIVPGFSVPVASLGHLSP